MIKFYENFTDYNADKLNEDIWVYIIGGHGFGNKELEYYTRRKKNIFIDHEGLHIKAYKEDYKDNHYTSARIQSIPCFKYGMIEFEIKHPTKLGVWPAIWMLADTLFKKEYRWPECGEIDLMESIGRMPNTVHFSLHSKDFNHTLNNHRTVVTYDIDFSKYHKYQIYWNETGFYYFIDGIKQTKILKDSTLHSSWPFDEEYHFIINLAIGGFFPGNPDEDFDNDELIIRYLKVTDEEYHEI